MNGLDPDHLAGVLKAVWWESRDFRAAIHRLVGVRHCDVVLAARGLSLGAGRGSAALSGLCVDGDCPCRDMVVDLLVESDRFLARAGGNLVNPPGAVCQHVRLRATGDWTRNRRTAMGAQARTDRIRRSARARSLPDGFHRALLEYLVDEAGSLAPLESDQQLHRRLADRAAAEFGGEPDTLLAPVLAAIPILEAAGRTGPRYPVAGGAPVTWWERYVEEPLGRRTRRGDLDVAAMFDAAPGVSPEEDGGCAVLDAVLPLALHDPTPAEAGELLVDTVRSLAERGLIAAIVAAGFAADPQRVAAAAAALLAVVESATDDG